MSYQAPFSLSRGLGPALSSAATITPTFQVHHMTGTTGVATITGPTGIQAGEMLTLIFDGLASLLITGNIAVAMTVTGVGQKAILVWDGTKWY